MSFLSYGKGAKFPARRIKASGRVITVEASCCQISLKLNIPYRCKYGQSVAIVGSEKALGSWDPKQALKMAWNEGDIWSTKIKFENCPKDLEYKYLVLEKDGQVNVWKPGKNYSLDIPVHSPGFLNVADSWDDCFKIVDFEEVQADPEEIREIAAPDPYRMLEEGVTESYRQLIVELGRSVELRRHAQDPAAADLLATDRRIAAANIKLVAYNRAVKATLAFPAVPPPGPLNSLPAPFSVGVTEANKTPVLPSPEKRNSHPSFPSFDNARSSPDTSPLVHSPASRPSNASYSKSSPPRPHSHGIGDRQLSPPQTQSPLLSTPHQHQKHRTGQLQLSPEQMYHELRKHMKDSSLI